MFKLATLVVFLMMVKDGQSGNFLMLPQPVDSHCLEMMGIADELMKRGHTVTFYIPDYFQSSNCFDNTKAKVITFKALQRLQESQTFVNKVLQSTFDSQSSGINIDRMFKFLDFGNSMCESALLSTDKLKLLKSLNIDIVLIDSLPIVECLYYVSKYLNTESVMIGSYIFPGYSGGPPQTHTFPFLFAPYTPNMTLSERVLNTLMTMGCYAATKVINWYSPFNKNNLINYVPREVLDIDVHDAARKSLLFLENNMDILDYPKAVYPNFIRVGGLTTRPANPLPQDLDDYFSKSKNGVIVVSFGSTLKKFPKQFFERLVNIFKNFKQNVVMSYFENAEYGNVKTMSWLPQNDVLAHKNTVLFVSHCGKNGLNEGFYHAVPIVCMPFIADQVGNGVKVKHLKIGDSIKILNSEDEEIIQTVKRVLNDKSVKANVKRLSAIYHDAKFTPRETAANAIEHVLKFGGDHLRPVSSDFNYLAENMTDVWFIIFMCMCLCIYLFYRLMKCCCLCMCRKQRTIVKNKKE